MKERFFHVTKMLCYGQYSILTLDINCVRNRITRYYVIYANDDVNIYTEENIVSKNNSCIEILLTLFCELA